GRADVVGGPHVRQRLTSRQGQQGERTKGRATAMAKLIEVYGAVEDETGAGDGAYDLLGVQTIDEFLARLRQTLSHEWGLTHAEGEVTLILEIKKVAVIR